MNWILKNRKNKMQNPNIQTEQITKLLNQLSPFEKNITIGLGLLCTHPSLRTTYLNEITQQLKTNQNQILHIIASILIDNAEILSPKYITQRILANPIDNTLKIHTPAYAQILIDAQQFTELPMARAHLQEILLENLSYITQSLPQKKDYLIQIKENAAKVLQILQTDDDSETPVASPFRALADGGNIQNDIFERKPTGIPVFDQGCLKGGLVTGSTLIIAGIMNAGKSFLMTEFLKEDAFLGGTPLICSLEDQLGLTQLRLTSFLLNKNTEKIEKMSSEEITQCFHQKYGKYPEKLKAISRIKIWAPENPPNFMQIIQKIKETEKKENCIITKIGVDYIQNINTDFDKSNDNRTVKLAKSAKALIGFAQKTNKNLIIVSQANLDDKKGVKFLDLNQALAESKAIGHNAQYILTLNVTKNEEERRLIEKDKRVRVNIALRKNKYGDKDAYYAIFNGQWQFFQYEHQRESAFNTTT